MALDGENEAALDRLLVERWRRGDRGAANALLTRHQPSIRAYFSRRANESDREDLVQETLARVTRSVYTFEYRCTFRAYLFRIAEHTLMDYLRAAHRRPIIEQLDEKNFGSAPAAEQRLIQLEELSRLRACMDSLAPETRHLVHRFYVQQLSARAIAMQDAVPQGTIRRRLFDARAAMQRHRTLANR